VPVCHRTHELLLDSVNVMFLELSSIQTTGYIIHAKANNFTTQKGVFRYNLAVTSHYSTVPKMKEFFSQNRAQFIL